MAIGPDGRVYVGTNQLGHGDAAAPSKVFAFSAEGRLLRDYDLNGQPLDQDHGIQGLAFDTNGLLYRGDPAPAAAAAPGPLRQRDENGLRRGLGARTALITGL